MKAARVGCAERVMSKSADRTVGHFLVLAARLHRLRASQLLSETGLFPGQETVLSLLSEHRDLAMGDLASALHVRPPTASKTVARLAAQGLVERSAGGGDARVVRVALTGAGKALTDQIRQISEALEDELVRELDGKDRKRLRKLLRKSAASLGRLTGSISEMEEEADNDKDDVDGS
jgi:DNA-binding MarR family transcriptional regulator